MDRLDTLKQMAAANPGDSFVRYGLAMEYVRAGQFDQGVAEFEGLLEVNPSYAAAFYHGGQALEKLGRLDDAREWYRRGIEVTTRSGDAHAASELQAAASVLGD